MQDRVAAIMVIALGVLSVVLALAFAWWRAW